MARHQRARRLRLRHRLRRADAPLPRPARRRAAHAVRPHDDVQLPLGAAALAGRPRRVAARRHRDARRARSSTRRGTSSASGSSGPAGLDLRGRGRAVREARADAAPPEHDAHHATGCCRASPCASSCGRSSRSGCTRRRSAIRSLRRTACRRSAIGSRSRRAATCRRCGCSCTARTRRSPSCPRRSSTAVVCARAEPRLRVLRRPVDARATSG